jgi:Co/Zn/Cd efflux system component
MKDCCEIAGAVADRQRGVLWAVLSINIAMFMLEFGGGLVAHSTALLADSVDMLGDAIVYGFSLLVVARGPVWQARVALMKGVLMVAFGIVVITELAVKLVRGVVPAADLMGGLGLVALIANVVCLALLWRRKGDDLNMRSAWVCSRNDVMANAAVLVAAAGVSVTASAWPDIVVGVAIAALFCVSAFDVIRSAIGQLRPVPLS